MIKKLTNAKLLFGVFIFTAIVNFLVVFDIQFFYLRAVFSFVFLTLTPGLLILKLFKVEKIGFWESLVYAIGLSLAFLMFVGLAINWILPELLITSKPLSLTPLLICFDIILLIFGFFAYKKVGKFSIISKLPKFDILNIVFITTSMIFPILSVFGAITLNNGGSNIFIMIMLGGVAVFSLLIVLLSDKVHTKTYPLIILTSALALLLATSLRSWTIVGHDIVAEYHIFLLTKESYHWNLFNLLGNSYNACLSLNILPTIYSSFLSVKNEYIFKLLFQIIFSYISVGLYILLRRYIKPVLAFASVLFFIYFPTFFIDLPMMIRQEISLLFFLLVLLVLFSKNINLRIKKILFIIFGFSMIVSHYSTSYIAIIFITLTYILTFIYRYRLKNRQKRLINPVEGARNLHCYLTKSMVMVLIVFGYLWYSLITQISGGLTNFITKGFYNINMIFNEEIRADQSSLLDQFNVFYKQTDPAIKLSNFVKETEYRYRNTSDLNFFPEEKYSSYNPKIVSSELLPLKIDMEVALKIDFVFEIIKKLVKIFIIIGVLNILFKGFKNMVYKIDTEFVVMIALGLFCLIAATILPLVTVDYSLLRVYQQMLIFLSLPAVVGGITTLKIIKNMRVKTIIISVIFILYFLSYSGFINQIIGGSQASIQLNNYGEYFDNYYVHDYDIESARWLSSNYNRESLIYADGQAFNRLETFSNIYGGRNANSILPSIIDKNAYVYLSYTNTVKQRIPLFFQGSLISYNNPKEFFDDCKNTIYSNGGSKILK